MIAVRLVRFRSIRQRLFAGFWLLVGLFVAAGLVARASMLTMSTLIGQTLSEVREDGQQASRLSASVSQELAAAARYLQARDSASQADFRQFASEAHHVQRDMYLNKGQAEDELSLIASGSRSCFSEPNPETLIVRSRSLPMSSWLYSRRLAFTSHGMMNLAPSTAPRALYMSCAV